MKRALVYFLLVVPVICFCQKDLKLWYQQPAKTWSEALPVGNGRLGAMIFGNERDELIQLNESTLWSGGPVVDNVNPDAPKYLSQVREAVFAGDYAKAALLSKKMQGVYSESYLPLGDLMIKQEYKTSTTESYKRDLNISNAVSTTSYKIGGVNYTRQIFSSAPDQVIVIRLTADKPSQLNFVVSTNSKLRYVNSLIGKDVLVTRGKAPTHDDPNYTRYQRDPIPYDDSTSGCRGMRYVLLTKVINKGGTLSADTSGISIKNANEVVLLLSAATSFNGYDKCPVSEGKDEMQLATNYLKGAAAKSFSQLLANHIKDYQSYFNRVSLNLEGEKSLNPTFPTDKRLANYSTGTADVSLEALYFQFGRYLLISSSRPGGTAANLQGIWNNSLRPPWSSNYTTNINVQMNYWPAEVANLSEMHQPLFVLSQELAVNGKKTAKEFYNLDGWVVHHNSDIWALSNPVGDMGNGDPKWANWAMGADWLCQHLWQHYQFTGNKKFLQDTAYQLMKDAVVFTLGWLVEDKDGYLVTAPSGSPENSFKDDKGVQGSIAAASTMDMSIIRDLFAHFIKASEILKTDDAFRAAVIEKQKKLYPFQIGKKGNIVEWYKDWEDVEVHHRHVSHLFGLYPAEQISPVTTPELANAARKVLEIRGDEGTGWSKAWKINFWARLLDGDHAYILLRDLLHLTGDGGTNYAAGGGTYPNLFDAHPPFQIDGNFGACAGIAEMLLQSQNDEVHMLPALPKVWINGKVTGLKARGGFVVSMNWQQHQLTAATVTSLIGGDCIIRTAQPVKIDGVNTKSIKDENGYVTKFSTQKGRKYVLSAEGQIIIDSSSNTINISNGGVLRLANGTGQDQIRSVKKNDVVILRLITNGDIDAKQSTGIFFDNIPHLKQGVAIWRYKPWNSWTKPMTISDATKMEDWDVQFFYWQYDDGSYGAAVPLSGNGFRTTLGSQGNKWGSKAVSYTAIKNVKEVPSMAIAFDSDPYKLFARIYKEALIEMGKSENQFSRKVFPKPLEYIGWCTWNSSDMGKNLNEEHIIEGVKTFTNKKFPLGWVLIDDGWFQHQHSQLQSLMPDPKKFPNGFKPLIKKLKTNYGVKYAGIWQAFDGYWNGIDPASPLGKQYKNQLFSWRQRERVDVATSAIATYHFIKPEGDNLFRFYDRWHSYFKSEGFDFVKVDNQLVAERMAVDNYPLFDLSSKMHEALYKSVEKNFNGAIINCMDMTADAYLNFGTSAVARTVEDYFPYEKGETYNLQRGNAAAHILQAVYNSVYFSQMVYTDYDMFESHNPNAELHALARTVNNGPIYLTDNPGKQNFEILKKIVFADGRSIRSQTSLLPSKDCLFQLQDNKLFKAFSLVGNKGLLLLMNLADTNWVEGYYKVADVEGLRGDKFILFDYFSKQYQLVNKEDSIKSTVPRLRYQLVYVLPIENDFATLGLIDKYNGPATILSESWTAKAISIQLYEGGEFWSYCKNKPSKVSINGKAADFRLMDDNILTINVPIGLKKPVVKIEWD